MVVRCPDGILKMQGAHHTDCLEAWFAHMPGLQVVIPSSPAEGKGLLKTAIRNDNPVMFFEHKTLFKMEGQVPDEEYTIPIGKARIAREEGRQHSGLRRYGQSCADGGRGACKEGIDAEVIDLRTVSPWDKETVSVGQRPAASLSRMRQLSSAVSVQSSLPQLRRRRSLNLKAPIVRIGAPFVPIPMTPHLEDMCRTLPKGYCGGCKKQAVGK